MNAPWASYQIRKIAGCACAGNAGKVFPRRRFQRKPLVSDPGMHHGTCVTHVPWCMSRSLTCGDGENVPGIPRACASAILRIWQEAHGWQSTIKFIWNHNNNTWRVNECAQRTSTITGRREYIWYIIFIQNAFYVVSISNVTVKYAKPPNTIIENLIEEHCCLTYKVDMNKTT